jgi:1,4-dihydroxy-2-naphthoate octaprenyltransferase
VVSVSIQIAVNYANDYSDGIKGTDDQRVGPVRLVGQKLASPQSVKTAAILFFFVAALSGLFITILSKQWWFLLLGLSAFIAAWTYTGGPKPYGYAGLGEVFVFIYFGLVAVIGTTYAQTLYIKPYFFLYAISIGLFASAILVANNLRDREKDKQNNKNTLAVKLGDQKTRNLYVLFMVLPFILIVSLFIFNSINPGTRIGATIQIQLLALVFAWRSIKPVINKVAGKELIPVLVNTGKTELLWALLVSIALVLETN